MKRQRMIFALIAVVLLGLSTRTETELTVDGAAVIPAETKKFVALTFDDGPRIDTTGRLLDGLLERGASATFFLLGQRIAGNEDLVRRMQTEGHQVGNHTWSHVLLQKMDRAAVTGEIGRTDALLREILGEGDYWVRPPYGLLTPEQRTWFTVPLVHWSVDPEDWKLRNADADVRAVLKKVKPGDIILMHDTVPATVDAAVRIVDALQEQGYTFVTVEELLALQGVTPEAGKLYHTAAFVE